VAKTSGLGAAISVTDATSSAQIITNDVTDFTLATPRAAQDITGVDKFAHERQLLLADASVGLKGVFNAAANMSHAVFKTVPSTSVARAVIITPTATSPPFLGFNALFETYSLSRSATGELLWDTTGNLSDGAIPTWS
jgi:regulation of enolase protein 1 (concanavalin A-like superfamily)